MDNILFLVSLPGPAEALIPVISQMLGKFNCKVVGLKKDNDVFFQAGGSYEVFRHNGLDVMDLAGDEFNDEWISEIISVFAPDVIVMGSVPDLDGLRGFPEKKCIGAARSMEIPVVQFVDSWNSWSCDADLPDYFFVIDDISSMIAKSLYGGRGDLPEILVTGHPGLEKFYRGNAGHKKFEGQGRAICYFTQINVDSAEVIKWLSGILCPEDILYIKTHPRDRHSYGEHAGLFSCRYEIADQRGENIYELINLSITHTSVVGLKSAILGIPTINIKPERLFGKIYSLLSGYPLSMSGLSVEANSERELEHAINNPVYPDKNTIVRHFNLNDASNSFADSVNGILLRARNRTRYNI